jgi:hypothetical protein
MPLGAATIGNPLPACPADGTLATLMSFDLNATPGCLINGMRYSDFSWTQTGGTVTLAASQINFTSIGMGQTSALDFTSSGFSVTGTDSLIYTLTYSEDPPPIIIRGVNQDMQDDPPVFPGFARIPTTVCLGSAFVNGMCSGQTASLLTFDDGNGNLKLHDSTTFNLQSTIGISSLIDLEANGASSKIDGFTIMTLTVPEPSSYCLAALGLAALFARWRKRARFSSNSLRRSD